MVTEKVTIFYTSLNISMELCKYRNTVRIEIFEEEIKVKSCGFINYSKEEAICVMLTSGGYPESYEKGKVISGLENLDSDIVVFHSGTKFDNENIVTNGGRVIGITAKGKSVKEAGEKVYENIKKINFEKMHYRKDIWK